MGPMFECDQCDYTSKTKSPLIVHHNYLHMVKHMAIKYVIMPAHNFLLIGRKLSDFDVSTLDISVKNKCLYSKSFKICIYITSDKYKLIDTSRLIAAFLLAGHDVATYGYIKT